MSLCESIDTLSMAYLDDELATEERREVELHLTECASCREHFDGERADQSIVRKALAAPAAPDLLRAKLTRALDDEDRLAARAERKRWSQWVLPGSAMLAAAAAIAVFVGVRPPEVRVNAVASEAFHQQTRALPLEVQGPSTGPWVREHFASLEAPNFAEPGIRTLGARLTSINNHDAVMISYQVTTSRESFVLTALAMQGVTDEELEAGEAIQVGAQTLHLVQWQGKFAVAFRGADRMAYMFIAPTLTPESLVQLVVHSSLFGDN